MAHVAKYKAGAVAGLVRHYGRTADEKNADGDPLERKNPRIKPERTHLNYNLAPTDAEARVAAAMAKHRVKAGRAPRKDAVVMADWVVTRPSDCPKEREKEFFKSVVGFVGDRYGKDNLLGAWVHMDETTPHVHVAFMPVRDDKLLASKVLDRNDLRSFHRELSERVKDDLGLEEPLSILVDRGDAARSKMNRLKVDEWMDAQKELEKVRAEKAAAEKARDDAGAQYARRVENYRLAWEMMEKVQGDKEFKDAYGQTHMGLRLAERTLRGVESALRKAREALDDATRGLWDMLRPLVVDIAAIAVERLDRYRSQPTREDIKYECDQAFAKVVQGWERDEPEPER